jgi:CCR4-NOT transcriptional regulation complex NOT5 subunit
MKNKEFQDLILVLLQTINKNVEELSGDTKYFVENEDKDPIAMPASVYEEICDLLESDYIPFMGIS